MPVHYRAQCTWLGIDSALPRDGITIDPCFRAAAGLSTPDAFASDLANGLMGWASGPFSVAQLTVKIYDIEGTKPVFPVGTAIVNPGGLSASGNPREVALCLSFFADHNLPRQRGRLYLPCGAVGATGTGLGVRPSLGQRQKAADLVPIFAGLGGADVDWIIWSQAAQLAHKVTNWWVDDEWDTVRKRGLRPTTRTLGTTSG
jgi:hypothetical protein